jgi:acetyl esterase/lipase
MSQESYRSPIHFAVAAVAILSIVLSGHAAVSPVAAAPQVVRLWEGDAPGALGKADKDIPTLTVYLPDANTATGAAMVICPGGGYAVLSHHEGKGYAQWLNQMGITCFVLKYRLGTDGYRHPCMLQDAKRSVRLVRANAEKWKIDPKRIGIIGSSAGGHMVAMLVTHFDKGDPNAADPAERMSCRPDMGILCYPVISMDNYIHKGSRKYLIGENPSQKLIDETSAQKNVRPDTPPCFIWHTVADEAVPVQNSLMFANALQDADVPYDLHIYRDGDHGIGLGGAPTEPDDWHPWTADCRFWLKTQGFLKHQ